MSRIFYLVQKEFRQIRRERAFIFIIFVMPFIQIVLFGFAVNTDVRYVPIAFVDMDRSQTSRRLLTAFCANETYTYSGMAATEEMAKSLLDIGKIQIAVVIPPHFERDLRTGNRPQVQAIIDGVDGNSAGLVLGYVGQIALQLQKEWLPDTGMPDGSPPVGLTEIVPRMWYNDSLESKNNIVPGIIATLVTMITAFLTGMSIVREKEIGTLEQLMVTPVHKNELIIGKTLPFMVVGFLLLNVGILAAGLIFGLWMKGSLLALWGFGLIFMLSTLGLGIFASTLAHTQQQAMFVVWFFALFAMLLSGFFIPIENMPRAIQLVTYLNPLRYFMKVVREIYLKGTPVIYLWKQALFMLVFGVVMILGASARFQKRVG
ncbi:ABC transporter permease [candidate division KSB1 bacterium]|nr:ABC transporter permease [candidate division KSB1 bacterium]